MKKTILTLTSLALITLTASAQLSNGLIAHYKLDGNGADSSGNNLHGTVMGATSTTNYKNESNKAMQFSSTSHYIDVPNSAALHPTSGITVAAWVYINNFNPTSPNASDIIKKGYDDNAPGNYLLRYTGSNKTSYFRLRFADNTATAVATTTTLTTGQWYHLLGSYDGNTMKMYINGTIEASQAVSKTMTSNTDQLRIGRNIDVSWPYPVDGKIDDVRIYDRALKESEIDDLYGILSSTKQVDKGTYFELYPNPSKGIFTIKSSEANTNIIVIDVTGKIVYNNTLNTVDEHTVDISKYNSGIYFVKVISPSGTRTKKIIIQ